MQLFLLCKWIKIEYKSIVALAVSFTKGSWLSSSVCKQVVIYSVETRTVFEKDNIWVIHCGGS